MVDKDLCQCYTLHEDTIVKAQSQMPSELLIDRVATLYKVFGDPTRIKILHLLSVSELCVCDIAYALGMTQSAISHQLKTLKQAHLVKNRKEGKTVYYALDDDHVSTILSQGLDHVVHKY